MMNTMKRLALFIAAAALLCGCSNPIGIDKPSEPAGPGTPIQLTKAGEEVAVRTNNFGLKLLQQIYDKQPGNICISPLSLMVDMALCASGADGQTASEMYQVMGLGDMNPSDVDEYCRALTHDLAAVDASTTFECANSMWFRIIEDFVVKQAFIDNAVKYYDAETHMVPFDDGTAEEINNWAASKTHNKIKQVVSAPFSKDIRFLLANAIYFNGKWSFVFKNPSYIDVFHGKNGDEEVEFMTSLGEFGYANLKSCQIASFPYGNGAYELLIAIPNDKYEVLDAIYELSLDETAPTVAAVHNRRRTVDVMIPKFKIEQNINFVNPLKQMGMTLPFANGYADFSKMSDLPLYISDIYQKTYIDVNETGTEAAAVTVIVGDKATSIGPDENPIFHADRPFLYILRETSSRTNLFCGIVR